ncbi:hypothetical protein EJB05_14243 [Eragrostis curvula]|uniref:Uncharacterized protein n=1 Tax=Eragrostis curvula TaxID=38414 RepID=A0A5J9VYR2_9POAL|nr:hypothetical protein EJB05_14243 [Eragrostis curvula]
MHDQVFVSSSVLHETRRIIHESEIMKEDDSNWTGTDRIGRQELEIHISFTTCKIGPLIEVQTSKDPEGLRIFYYLVQELGANKLTLINVGIRGGA